MFYKYRTFRMNLMPKNAVKYYCEKCDFKCSKQSNWSKHISTSKHINGIKMVVNGSNLMLKNAKPYKCECGKTYKWDSGFYRHKKKCGIVQDTQVTTVSKNEIIPDIDKELLVKMLLKNSDMMEKMFLKNSEVMENILEAMPQIGKKFNTCNDYV